MSKENIFNTIQKYIIQKCLLEYTNTTLVKNGETQSEN